MNKTKDFEVLNLLEADKWKHYLSVLPIKQQDIYFTPEYYEIYQQKGDGRAECFVYKEGTHLALYPYLVNSIDIKRYNLEKAFYDIQGAYGYNGVISTTNSDVFKTNFYNTFNDYCKEVDIIAEFTRFHPIINNHSFSDNFLRIIKNRNVICLDLSKNYEIIWIDEYSSKNRNMIRKAQKKSFRIKTSREPSWKEIIAFHEVYEGTMRENHAAEFYYFSDEYFANLFEKLRPNVILIEILNDHSGIECAAIILNYRNYAHYYLSSRRLGSDNSVNNYLLDEAIKMSISNGAKYFYFGGGRTSDPDDLLLKFKSNFSKTTCNFYIGVRIHNKEIYSKIVQQWNDEYPQLSNKYSDTLLKYRFFK